jgi:hydroxymethylbilane synthase
MRIGTRASALALAQARWVAERIDGDTELVTITTAGPVGDKSRWVSALERALLDDEIDVAVHSAKDVPAELAPGLELAAVPERADPRDALCGCRSLAELPAGARVGTSSLRRTAQLRAERQDLEVIEIRGNVDTRLRKLRAGECDALVLALAGLHRLGLQADGVLDQLVPAAGQGALAIEARPGWTPPPALSDRHATACLHSERELTRALGASCDTSVGAHARVVGDRAGELELELQAWAGLPDGSAWVSDRLAGPAEGLGEKVAARMLTAGAGELLRAGEAAA